MSKSLIESKIDKRYYTLLPTENIIVCTLVMNNGFTVIGDSGVISKSDVDSGVGEVIAYNDAFDKASISEKAISYKKLFIDKNLDQYKTIKKD